MPQSSEEIAQIVKIGTTVMLMISCGVIGLVLFLHQKLVKEKYNKF